MSNGLPLGVARPMAAGFVAPVLDSQAAFRAVMDGLARPGRIIPLETALSPPPPLAPLAAALALTLLDFEVRYHLAPSLAAGGDVAAWIGFHTGARTAPAGEAEFVFVDLAADRLTIADHAQGSEDYPDRSATLIAQAESVELGQPIEIAGPGIDGRTRLTVSGLPGDFAAQWRSNRAGFPLGVDLVFVAGDRLVGLPRSVRMLEGGG